MSNLIPTDEQKEFVWRKFEEGADETKTLTGLFVDMFYPDEPENMKDGRSKYGKLVKTILAEKSLKPIGAHEYVPKEKLELTEDHRQFIDNNMSMMKANEIARVIFEDSTLMPLSQETRAVLEYIKSVDQDEVDLFERPEETVTDGYKPPRTQNLAINKVNKYVLNGIDRQKITDKDRRNLQSLISYLNTYRFCHQMGSYGSLTDRELFESSFVRYAHDKGDLYQEEVDQYIVLAGEVVIASNIQRRVEHLQNLLDDAAADTEGRRIAMSLVEAISTAQTEYNQCVNRQQKLLESLKQKRSDKLKSQIKENASIINLVQMWKEEETRKKLIKLADLRKKAVANEVDKLTSMDEVKATILGLSKDEVLNG